MCWIRGESIIQIFLFIFNCNCCMVVVIWMNPMTMLRSIIHEKLLFVLCVLIDSDFNMSVFFTLCSTAMSKVTSQHWLHHSINQAKDGSLPSWYIVNHLFFVHILSWVWVIDLGCTLLNFVALELVVNYFITSNHPIVQLPWVMSVTYTINLGNSNLMVVSVLQYSNLNISLHMVVWLWVFNI